MKKFGIFVSVMFLAALIVAVIVIPKIDMTEFVEITADEDFKEYRKLKDENMLDENDEYIVKFKDPDKIRVTFAKNQSLDVEYYFDENKTQKIEETAYLMPGDTIYFKCIEILNKNKELYKFSRYEVYEISDESGRERIVKLNDPEAFFTIPENFKGKEIQIVPYGEYEKGVIHLNAYCSGYGNIKETVATGTWMNGDVVLQGSVFNVGPSENYTLIYKYNADEYFFLGSSPECFSCNAKDGVVEFKDAESSEADNPKEYSVELKHYLKLSVESDEKAKILINGNLIEEKTKKYDFTSDEKLKFGDKIIIETEGNIEITDGDYKYVNITRNFENELFKYIITFSEDNLDKKLSDKICDGVEVIENVTITLPEKNQYGTVTYKVNSEEVKGTRVLKEGDKLKAEYTIIADGYVFSDRNAFEKIFNPESKSITIEIKSDMDGKTLNLSEHFKVEKESEK